MSGQWESATRERESACAQRADEARVAELEAHFVKAAWRSAAGPTLNAQGGWHQMTKRELVPQALRIARCAPPSDGWRMMSADLAGNRRGTAVRGVRYRPNLRGLKSSWLVMLALLPVALMTYSP